MRKFVFYLLFLFVHLHTNAQIIINKPTLGFTQACASSSFNSFTISFTFFPATNLGPGNQFFIELSDNNGSFSAPTVLKTLVQTVSPISTSFSFPTNISGNSYQIRVRSTNPISISPSSVVFPAYYAIYNQVFTINNNVPNLKLCKGQSATLSVDSGLNSPLQYPQLVYKWFKNNTVIPGETGPSINVSQAANYYVAIDYGLCNYNSYSNQVSVNLIDIDPAIQTQDLSDLICLGIPKRINCLVQNVGYVYQWYKDGLLIPGESNYYYDALLPGVYKVIVSNQGCFFSSNEITLVGPSVSASIVGPSIDLIIPGQVKTISVTSNALAPTYTWYRNGGVIPGEVSSSLNITLDGVYKAVVRQNDGCITDAESSVTMQYPLNFEIGIKNELAYQQCISTSASLVVDKFNAITSSTPVSILGNAYNYVYNWYKNGVLVSSGTTSSLLITNALANGDYKLGVSIPFFTEVFSNSIDVQLPIVEDITIAQVGSFCLNGNTFNLQSKLSNPNYIYEWYFNGNLVLSSNSNSYAASLAGNYHLIVRSGSCFVQSNAVNVQEASFSGAISTSPNTLLLPGEQKIISTSTTALQPTYVWYKDNAELLGETASTLTVSQASVYKVVIKQNQGCVIEKNWALTIEYPTSFTVTISPSSDYQECVTTSTILNLKSFTANSSLGNVDLISNPYNYTFQWYRNNIAIPGANALSFPLPSYLENADYKLEVLIPGLPSVFSNSFKVKLGFTTPLLITTADVFCDSNSLITITSNYNEPGYTYEWFEGTSSTILGTLTSITVSKTGSYFLKVSYNGCTIFSNTLAVLPFDYSPITVDAPDYFSLIPGSSRIITALGADGYEWYEGSQLVSIASGYKVTKEGIYVLKAKIGVCELIKTFIVDYKKSYVVIPNVVTLNGDGYNDYWTLPLDYAYKEDVLITVYNSKGVEVLSTLNYQNNWPQSDFEFSKADSVYYFNIQDKGEIVKRGSITFIK